MQAGRLYEHLPNAADAAWGINLQPHKRQGDRGFIGMSIGADNEA